MFKTFCFIAEGHSTAIPLHLISKKLPVSTIGTYPSRKEHECPICKHMFYSKSILNRHISTVHSGICSGPIKCSYCSFACSSEDMLTWHCKETHKYICEACNKAFSSISGIYNHNRVNHGSKEDLFNCQICGKTYGNVSRLEIHMRSHSDKKNYQCLICKKSYKYKCTLDHHTCEPSD